MKLADSGLNSISYVDAPFLKNDAILFSWAPDDGSIVYARTQDGISNIWRASFDGTSAIALTSNGDKNESYAAPIWTSDGRTLVFASVIRPGGSAPQQYRIWSMDIEGRTLRVVFESAKPFTLLGLNAASDGALIAERLDASNVSLVASAIDLSVVSLRSGVKNKVAIIADVYFRNIHVSQDGRSIAYVTRRSDSSEIWTQPVAGGPPKRIFTERDPKVLISSLAWAPDGRNVVFGKQTRTNVLSMLTN